MSEKACRAFVVQLVATELQKDVPDLVALSIALGNLESCLTDKKGQRWPENLEAEVESGAQVFSAFVDKAAAKINEQNFTEIRDKVKAVADLIWSHLTGSFSKDVQHVQHIHTFTCILEAGKGQGKRQLDCAGVVTTTLAVCQHLSRQEGHSALAACRLQVSEDHCWINYDPEGAREGSVEVTTDNASRRGHAVSPEAWVGWLYTGGQAVLCTPKMAMAALLASVNPSINPRQNSGTDSEELQSLQHDLLALVKKQHPPAVYPAALCCLADLTEIARQDELQVAVAAGQAESVSQILEQRQDGAQGMFEEAIAASLEPHLGAGLCWYPYSYLIGYLTRRARFILTDAAPLLGEEASKQLGAPLLDEALRLCGKGAAAKVLQNYRFAPTDEQLHKDLEGVLEMACEIVKYLAGQAPEGGLSAHYFVPLLELWDGVCWYWSGRPKPASWLTALLRTAKLFPQAARVEAASAAQADSQVMEQARELWGALKLPQLKPIFEAADVNGNAGRTSKRPRR